MNSRHSKRALWGASIAVALGASSLFAVGGAKRIAPESPSAEKLLNERLDVLQQIAVELRKGYRLGETDLASVLAAEQDALAAQLELADTPADRISILEKMVKNAQQQEEGTEQLYRDKAASSVDWLKAKAFRLRVQADLARARSTARR